MVEASVAVVKRDAAIEGLIDVDFGLGEAEATGLLGDLEAAAFPLDDVVVADGAFLDEAADTVKALGSLPPGGFHFTGFTGETAVVVSDESTQDDIGGVEVHGFGQPQFAGEAILQHAPETLDAACGLLAAMKVTPSCSRARPNWVGWRLPASCSSTVQKSLLRTKMAL